MSSVHLLVKGRVQGVSYRASARDVAEALDLTGWIRNTPSGDVEIMATGSEKSVQQFIEWCKDGPATAAVSSVNVTGVAEQRFDSFRIVRG